MRNLPLRPSLPDKVQKQLATKTKLILEIPPGEERKKQAEKVYEAARKSKWFQPVVENLRKLCGEGELCMYCSSNEPSQVEHYRPKSVFPERALEYENYLWACDICNRAKSDRFPPDTEAGESILNPMEDNVWEHFFLEDTFGRLLKRTDGETEKPFPRAESTCKIVGIDRENVQIKRKYCFSRLKRDIQRALEDFQKGQGTVDQLRDEIARWRTAPFQADVADYFLKGPGRAEEPFRSALLAVGEAVP